MHGAAEDLVDRASRTREIGIEIVAVHGPSLIVERPVDRKLQLPRPASVPSGCRVLVGWDEVNPQVIVATVNGVHGTAASSSGDIKNKEEGINADSASGLDVNLERALYGLERGGSSASAYGRIFHAALTSDRQDDGSLFASASEVLAAWGVWDPVVQRTEGTGSFARAARLEVARLAQDSAPSSSSLSAGGVMSGESESDVRSQLLEGVDDALLEQQRDEARRLEEAKELMSRLSEGQRQRMGVIADPKDARTGNPRAAEAPSAHEDMDVTEMLPPLRLYTPGDASWLGLQGPASWVRCDDNECSLDAMAVGDSARAGMLPPLAREAALQRAEMIR